MKLFIIKRWVKVSSMAIGTWKRRRLFRESRNKFYLPEEFQKGTRELNLLRKEVKTEEKLCFLGATNGVRKRKSRRPA